MYTGLFLENLTRNTMLELQGSKTSPYNRGYLDIAPILERLCRLLLIPLDDHWGVLLRSIS